MLIPCLLLAFAAPEGSGALEEAKPPSLVRTLDAVDVDKSKIRFGSLSDFDPEKGHRVATVRSQDVYLQIPAYQTILKEGIEKGTARWNQLMQEATAQFKKALRTVAANGSYVLIVEEGGISGYSTTDASTAIIDAL